MPFRIGESVVQLGHWEPHMTVESIKASIVTCVWFDNDGHVRRSEYTANQLEPWHDPNHQIGEAIPFCELGELVQLRSNGYFPLTVLARPVDGRVQCSWANGEDTFRVDTLVRWREAIIVDPA